MSFSIQDECKEGVHGSHRLLPQDEGRAGNAPITRAAMCDDAVASPLEAASASSERALGEQQKAADENLFLRYLELDPVDGPDAIPAATQRRATGIKNGRTPFTHTKRLLRAGRSGFGFSVVWTHPPRVERVERGMPAERAGILPGDYIIFVDKHNVVMMPEVDVLNLIRSHGNQLTLEIFRRNSSRNGSVPSVKRMNSAGTVSSAALPSSAPPRRPSTVCSTNATSVDCGRRKLNLPQVTFNTEKPSNNPEENRNSALYQLIGKEQQYATAMQFAVTRYVAALAERRDLITPSEHKTLFQNSEEILRISEDVLDTLVGDDGEPQIALVCRVYRAKLAEFCAAYRRYCAGIKRADCVLASKAKSAGSEFARFVTRPEIPRRRPDITTFIHKPLEHFREVLRLLTAVQGLTKSAHDDYSVINAVVRDLQTTYREITSESGLMEPVGSGRPLLTVQDVENRLVFTKCKPFVLNKPGRQWIFGGDLTRVEGRNARQYWTMLFSDLLLFARVSRDRVLFVNEEPLPLAHVADVLFNIRKKDTEFRILVDPEGGAAAAAASPTVRCGPELTRTPRRRAAKKTIVLKAPTVELKAMWQNLLQRQISYINTGPEGSCLSSPLDSPIDVPITSSVATLQSAESLSLRRQNPQNINQNANSEYQKELDALIELKCKELSQNSNTGKDNAFHLEKWIQGHVHNEEVEMEPLLEEWTPEALRKRSEELHLIDCQGNLICRRDVISQPEETPPSPSKSSTISQATIRSSPLPESLPVCRQCHKNCLTSINDKLDDTKDWRPLVLMGLSATPAVTIIQDPFAPTKDDKIDATPDDSPQSEDHPYHSLSSSNLTIRRYGTVSSLEKLGFEELEDYHEKSDGEEETNLRGIDNEGFNSTAVMSWTMRAGMFVAEKMSFFERLGEDYKPVGFFDRYLKQSVNGEEPEEETSGGTSGEDLWGTPTSGDLDDANSPNYEEKQSPNDGSISSDYNEDTELMMDELLMTPPITGAVMRGLLPRRTLEPLIEEDISDSSSSESVTPTEPTSSSKKSSEDGNAADTCSAAAESPAGSERRSRRSGESLGMPRSSSYRKIVEAAEERTEETMVGFFDRFRPVARFSSIERVPKTRSVKIFEFFNVRRMDRRGSEVVYPEQKEYVKMFNKEGECTNNVPAFYNKQNSPKKSKDKQMDRRFWKQLSKRRATKGDAD